LLAGPTAAIAMTGINTTNPMARHLPNRIMQTPISGCVPSLDILSLPLKDLRQTNLTTVSSIKSGEGCSR
jgi:hypothetical protein